MLEALARDIPTLFFWQVADWPSRPEAEKLYRELSSVQVFHASPESAAEEVNRLMPEVQSWWHNPRRRQAVSHYKNTFAQTGDQWVGEWAKTVGWLS
jgi:putative transferase (TIGR04331 family)